MKTGFKNLDKIIDIEQPEVILLTGINFADIKKKYNLETEHSGIYEVAVYDTNNKIGTCKLKYDFKYRRFMYYE